MGARFPDTRVTVWVSREGEFWGKDGSAWTDRRMRFDSFARQVSKPDPRRRMYLAAQPLSDDFHALRRDLRLPESLRRARPRVLMWIGQAGNHTRPHYDVLHNLFIQVSGSKVFTVVSPRYIRRLSPSPAESSDAAVSALTAIPPSVPQRQIRVRPGDVLFLPAFWWHEVHTEEGGISVNCWWRPPLADLAEASLARLVAHPFVAEDPRRLRTFVRLPAGRSPRAVVASLAARSG